jgi:prepilin-type N-terminal cleavage/methylation domain-containing protein
MQRRHTLRWRCVDADGRGGFTLLEILVVLSVLALLIGITWPTLRGFIAEQEIERNRFQVWEDMSKARIWAIDSGQAYQVRYEPYGRNYIILPYDQPPAAAAETATQQTPILSGELTEYCRFSSVNFTPSGLSEDPPTFRITDEWLASFPNRAQLAEVGWSNPIVFYPDGSATEMQWTLIDEDDRSISFSVRALTGVVTTGKIERGDGRPGL